MKPDEREFWDLIEVTKRRVAAWPAWKKAAAARGLVTPREDTEKEKKRRPQMTKDEALDLMDQYCSLVKELGGHNEVVTGLRSRWPEGGSEKKAMRWLGFMQGVLYITNIFTLEELKKHSRDKIISGPQDGAPVEKTEEIEWFGGDD